MRTIITAILVFGYSWQVDAQNVGIGTATPLRAKLEVIGVAGSGATGAAFGTDGAGISLQRNWPTIGFNQYRDDITPGSQGKYMSGGYAAIQYFDPGSGTFAIDMFPSGTAHTYTPAATRGLTIYSNGSTKIRTAAGNAMLTVGRGNGYDGTAVIAGTQRWSHFNYSPAEDTYIRAGADGSNVYINKIPAGDVFIGNGNSRIGINNYNPGYTIDLVQPVGVHSISLWDQYGYAWHQRLNHINTPDNGDGNTLDLYYGSNAMGRFRYYDGQYVSYSDRRLKTGIETLSPVLQNINLLNPVTYEMKNDNTNHYRSVGFIAQEVTPLFPQLVRQINYKDRAGTIGDFNTMNYSTFGVLAIKALQEQWQELKALEAENNELLLRLSALEQKLTGSDTIR